MHTNATTWTAGHIAGSFNITMPLPQNRVVTWSFAMDRSGALSRASCTNNSCAAGQNCDVPGQLCLPGTTPMPQPTSSFWLVNFGVHANFDKLMQAALTQLRAAAAQIGSSVFSRYFTQDGTHLFIPFPPIHFAGAVAQGSGFQALQADEARVADLEGSPVNAASYKSSIGVIGGGGIIGNFNWWNIYTDGRSNNAGFDGVYDEAGLDLMFHYDSQPADFGYRACKEQFTSVVNSMRSYNPNMHSGAFPRVPAQMLMLMEPPGGNHEYWQLNRLDVNADQLCDQLYGSLKNWYAYTAADITRARNKFIPCTVKFDWRSDGKTGYQTYQRWLENGYDTSCQSMYKRSVAGWGNADQYNWDSRNDKSVPGPNNTSVLDSGPMMNWLRSSCYAVTPYGLQTWDIKGFDVITQSNISSIYTHQYVGQFTDTNQTIFVNNGTPNTLNVYLCPMAEGLMGPYRSEEVAGRLSCYGQPNGGAPSLDSFRQHGPQMDASKDPRCGDATGPVPGAVALFHLRDASPDGLATETQTNLFNACLTDLERDPTKARAGSTTSARGLASASSASSPRWRSSGRRARTSTCSRATCRSGSACTPSWRRRGRTRCPTRRRCRPARRTR